MSDRLVLSSSPNKTHTELLTDVLGHQCEVFLVPIKATKVLHIQPQHEQFNVILFRAIVHHLCGVGAREDMLYIRMCSLILNSTTH